MLVFDSLLRGRTFERVVDKEDPEPAFPFFLDLAVNNIVAFQCQEGGALVVWLDNSVVVTCVDDGKGRELLEIGGFVQLFNAKSFCHGLFVTAKSGVRKIVFAQPLLPSLSPPQPCQPLYKWQCIVCSHVNYPRKVFASSVEVRGGRDRCTRIRGFANAKTRDELIDDGNANRNFSYRQKKKLGDDPNRKLSINGDRSYHSP